MQFESFQLIHDQSRDPRISNVLPSKREDQSTMAKARPKQQHYVTKAYLDGFLAPGASQLVCYARNGKTFSRRTQDIAKERNFYAFKNEKGEWDDSLEELIERTVETPGLPVLQKLALGNTRLKWEERTALAVLVAFQEVRTPASLQRTIDYTRALTEKMLRDVREADPTQKTIDLIGKDGTANTVTLAEMEQSQADLEKENGALPARDSKVHHNRYSRHSGVFARWVRGGLK